MELRLVSVCIFVVFSCFISVESAGKPEVWLTVSSTAEKANGFLSKKIQRRLELNWINGIDGNDTRIGDWLGLFDKNVGETVSVGEALFNVMPKAASGRYVTKISFPIHNFTDGLTSDCMGFYVAYVSGKTVVAKNCIRAQPNWMRDNLKFIENKSVKQIIIPGTHNAGAYEIGYVSGSFSTEAVNNGRVKNYVICQDETIFNQLAYGIRFLDFRIGYDTVKGREEKYWMFHDIVRVHWSLNEAFGQIKRFLELTEKEIVILDMHRFPVGFDMKKDGEETFLKRHGEVLQLLEDYLGKYLVTSSNAYDTKIGDLLRQNKRVIVGHCDSRFLNKPYINSAAKHLWADKDTLKGLEEHLQNNVCQSDYRTIAAMAQLTPKITGTVLNSYGGLRMMADQVNPAVTEWFRDRWGSCANVVATDYFLGNDIIEVAIQANKRRAN